MRCAGVANGGVKSSKKRKVEAGAKEVCLHPNRQGLLLCTARPMWLAVGMHRCMACSCG